MLKNANQNKKDIFIISKELIEDLKKMAFKSDNKRYRYCIHKNNDHLTQEMIIVFHKDTIITPHRHPKGRSESYHVIEGSMNVSYNTTLFTFVTICDNTCTYIQYTHKVIFM